MQVCVVIPCLNEEKYLGLLLSDLKQQTKRSEIIVADCHSTDKTVGVAKKYGAKVVFAPYKSAGSARNAGADKAKTEYILFLDADMRIPPDFIEKMYKKAETKKLDIVSPRFKSTGRHLLDLLNALVVNFWVLRNMKIYKRPMLAGGGILIKKKVHDQVGGFDEKMQQFNDVDFSKRLQKIKCSFSFAWSAVAVASNRRFVEQGRIKSTIQQLPPDSFIVRKFIRPHMHKIGIHPKWED